MGHKERTDKKRAEKAKEDELKDYNDPNSMLEGDDGGSTVELGDSRGSSHVSLLEVSEGGDPAQQEETKDEPTKPKKKDPPKPYEHPEPPYDLWMSQAASFPPGKLLPPDKGPTQLPKVTAVDVKKYREGREGDEVGLKIGLKELRQKSKIEKTTAQRNMFESEKGLKAKMMAGAKNTQNDFKKSERRSKEEAKEAAKDPEKSGSGADEQAHKERTDKKRAEKAEEDELKDYNDPNSMLEGDDGGWLVTTAQHVKELRVHFQSIAPPEANNLWASVR